MRPHVNTSNSNVFSSPCTGFANGTIGEIASALEYGIERAHGHVPIHRLPIELITSIFNLCLPDLPSRDVFVVGHNRIVVHPVQLHLSSICRRWRQVVFSTPKLWTTLSLYVSARTTVTQSELVAEWLGRSGHLPLDVTMSYIGDFGSFDDDVGIQRAIVSSSAINSMIDTICLYTSRIRVLHLCLLGSYISHFGRNWHIKLTGDVDASKSILEKLSIDVSDRDFMGADVHPATFRLDGQIPEPTQVCFKGICLTSIHLSWGCVTCLETGPIEKHNALKLLQMAPGLQRLETSIIGDRQLVPIIHHSLQVLRITYDSSVNFLECLTCPALEELAYYADSTVRTFLHRSACPLQKLSLQEFDESLEDDLVPLLRFTPSLTHLTLNHLDIPDELFGETTDVGQSNSETDLFLPHLSCFISNGAHFDLFHWSNIPLLIRRFAVSEIKINFRDEADFEDDQYTIDRENLVETLELVQDRGVVLSIRDGGGNDLILWSQLIHELI